MQENFSTPKILGGIGSILCALAITPHLGPLTALIGFIFLLISLNMFSKIFKDERIFKQAFISIIFASVAIILIIFIFGLIGFFIIRLSYHSYYFHFFHHLGITSFLGFLVAYILLILNGYYLKSAFELLSFHTEITLYKAGGVSYFIGTILSIIFIGFLVIFAAWIILAVAFFITPDEKKEKTPDIKIIS